MNPRAGQGMNGAPWARVSADRPPWARSPTGEQVVRNAVRSRQGHLASGRHRAAPGVGPSPASRVRFWAPGSCFPCLGPEQRAVRVVLLRAPLLSGARLKDTTVFLPNFPAELTGACEGQGACPGSLSKTAKPLASGQGRRTPVPAPGRLTRGSFINNGNNRASLSLSRADSCGRRHPGCGPRAPASPRRLRGLSGGSVGSGKGTCNSRRRTWRGVRWPAGRWRSLAYYYSMNCLFHTPSLPLKCLIN